MAHKQQNNFNITVNNTNAESNTSATTNVGGPKKGQPTIASTLYKKKHSLGLSMATKMYAKVQQHAKRKGVSVKIKLKKWGG